MQIHIHPDNKNIKSVRLTLQIKKKENNFTEIPNTTHLFNKNKIQMLIFLHKRKKKKEKNPPQSD